MDETTLTFEEIITKFCPDAFDFVADLIGGLSDYFVGGVLIAFLLWVIGYTIYTIFGLLDGWLTSSREEG